MAAFRISDWLEPASLVEVEVPEPGPGQARVRVAGCGLCHSDLAMGMIPADLGAAMGWQVPFTLRHGPAGGDTGRRGVTGIVRHLPLVSPRRRERLPQRRGGPGLRARRGAG
jgi:propanol-preferring alcohol dehydrogenase